MDGGFGVQPLQVSEGLHRPSALALVAQVKEQTVVAQAVGEDGHGKHLYPRAVEAVAVDDGAASLAACRNIPALEEDCIARGELDGMKVHAVRLGCLPVVGIVEMKLACCDDGSEEPRHHPEEEYHQQRNHNVQ